MLVGVPKETVPGERRVAVVPAELARYKKLGLSVIVESGAGVESGFSDDDYREKGAEVASARAEVFAKADIICQVRSLAGDVSSELALAKNDQTIIGMCDPLGEPAKMQEAAGKNIRLFSLELIPRITRAQSMDVLSSMAMIAGYRAVLLAAEAAPRIFPMMITAAGTVPATKVFVVGVGVAGLNAIATAKRLGSVVEAYDVRPEVKDQVVSVGGRFVELPMETASAGDAGGYAKAQDESFYRRQRELMTQVVAANDVVITTAAVPGKKSPILVTEDMVKGMKPGSVIVDLAAERGGNVEGTEAGKTVVKHGVTIIGPENLASTTPANASPLFARNVSTYLGNMIKDGQWKSNNEDEIVRETLVAEGGQVVHARIRGLLGLIPLEPPVAATT